MADMLSWDERDICDDDDGPCPSAFITCRYCGKTGFEWGIHEGKWRLHDRKGVHMCKIKPLPEKPKPRVITDPIEKTFRVGFDMGHRSAMDEACPEVGPGSYNITPNEAWKNYREENAGPCTTDQDITL